MVDVEREFTVNNQTTQIYTTDDVLSRKRYKEPCVWQNVRLHFGRRGISNMKNNKTRKSNISVRYEY